MAGLFGKGEEYFLDEDDSKSFGNIDYMRTSKVTRRTFPKTASNQVGEIVKQVSATEDQKVSDYKTKSFKAPETNGNSNGFQAKTFSSFQPAVTKPVAETTPETPVAETTPETPVAEPTPVVEKPASTRDDSMDMFLNMAKQIRGGRR